MTDNWFDNVMRLLDYFCLTATEFVRKYVLIDCVDASEFWKEMEAENP